MCELIEVFVRIRKKYKKIKTFLFQETLQKIQFGQNIKTFAFYATENKTLRRNVQPRQLLTKLKILEGFTPAW